MKYLAMQAMLNADHQKLERTQKLATLGAAGRQELEEITAIHTGHETEVAAARQRLLLLGLGPDDVSRLTEASHVVSEVTVRAPASGVVIARGVNPGQVISAGQELFTVTDLSTVWAIGDLYEKDFPVVRVGSEATVTVPGAAGRRCADGRLHRPAGRSSHANRQGARGGAEQGRRSATGHVRDAQLRDTLRRPRHARAAGRRAIRGHPQRRLRPRRRGRRRFAERVVKLGAARRGLVRGAGWPEARRARGPSQGASSYGPKRGGHARVDNRLPGPACALAERTPSNPAALSHGARSGRVEAS